jgi:hypothetical protein
MIAGLSGTAIRDRLMTIDLASHRPLRMQCPHPGEAAPQWYPRSDKAPAETVEQLSGRGTAQPLAYRPDVHFDDLLPEGAVVAD